VDELSRKMREGIADCHELIDANTAAAYNREWAGLLECCAVCEEQLREKLEFFADAEIYPDEGNWGLLCPWCLTDGANQMVWGKGQLYQYRPDRQAWVMVAGFPPRHLWEQ
jgi:hypothetical protein